MLNVRRRDAIARPPPFLGALTVSSGGVRPGIVASQTPVPEDDFDKEVAHCSAGICGHGGPTDAELRWAVEQLPDDEGTAKVRAALARVPWLGKPFRTQRGVF